MTLSKILRPLSLLLLLTAWSVTARADQTSDSVGKMHYEEGQRLFKSGSYRDALAEFSAGYDATNRPAFLLNIAQSHRKLGNLEKAREFYKSYLREAPNNPQLNAEVQRFIAELDAEIAARPPVVVEQPPQLPPPTPKAPPEPPYVRKWTWVGLGLSIAALGAGAGLEAVAHQKYSDLQKTCPQNVCPANVNLSSKKSEITTYGNAAIGLFAVGGAFAVGTIAAAILETRAIHKSQTQASIAVTPTFVGLSLSSAF